MAGELTKRETTSAVSRRYDDGQILEAVYSEDAGRTQFALWNGKIVSAVDEYDEGDSLLTPISASNNLIKHRAVLLPECAEPYESVTELSALISGYLFRYVDLSDSFRKIATCYALLTWIYDAFNELPYLRLRGDFGSGKTRALSIIGSICYRPFFASGASTVSPIFHTLDSFGGTLVLDEADFRFSDEKSELVKIFNNGNVRGFPVLRTAITLKKEFDPRAFNVYGPKIIAMRKSFEDEALESRFLTENMGQRPLRPDIPINLPDEQKAEARALRNKLLMYRFQTLSTVKLKKHLVDPSLSPRLNQILVPLLSILDDRALQDEIRKVADGLERYLYRNRAASMEAQVLETLLALFKEEGRSHVAVKEVADSFREQHGADYDRPITNRLIGHIIRKKLFLYTYKSDGIYIIPASELPKTEQLAVRFGLDHTST